MEQLEWIPLYIDKLLSSQRWNGMHDYQRGWYLQLLLRSARSERPGYLKVDSNLWTIAGAKRKDFWDAHSSIVLACFKVREMDGHKWLYNDRLLTSLEVAKGLHDKPDLDAHMYLGSSFEVDCKSKSKPSLEEVIKYCNERKNAVDPNQWFDYYMANGWKVGRNPMKDWRAAVRTWEKHDGQNGSSGRNHQAKAPRKTVQHERWEQNIAAVRIVFPDLNMGANPDHDGAGQKTRLSARDSRLLEGEIKPIRGRGNC